MSVKIELSSIFEKRFIRLQKKFPNVHIDLEKITEILAQDPRAGDAIPQLYEMAWKIRMASSDMKKGKSGGFRIIYYYKHPEPEIVLLDIYAKNERADIPKKEIEVILKAEDLI